MRNVWHIWPRKLTLQEMIAIARARRIGSERAVAALENVAAATTRPSKPSGDEGRRLKWKATVGNSATMNTRASENSVDERRERAPLPWAFLRWPAEVLFIGPREPTEWHTLVDNWRGSKGGTSEAGQLDM